MALGEDEMEPDYLESSELGTKAYWDKYYQRDLDGNGGDNSSPIEPSQLESWFDDVGAPEKVFDYLTSTAFPLFANDQSVETGSLPLILDLGTGNGSTLISLALESGIKARMVGVDYSEQSVELARQLWTHMRQKHHRSLHEEVASLEFAVFDIIRDSHKTQPWWPVGCSKNDETESMAGFDLVIDKGTFDAISLSSETIADQTGAEKKIFEIYPVKVADMVRPGGFFLITSCNWTEEEVVQRFSTAALYGVFDVIHRIKYPVYQFGGQQGQGVASVCFQKRVAKSG